MRDRPNQSFYLEGHSLSAVDGDNNDDDKNNDNINNDNYDDDNNNGKVFTLRNAR